MSLTQVWGSLVIFVVCPLLGGLPLIDWLSFFFTGRQLSKLGTGNVSVSAAFYHGGRLLGVLAVLAEAFKGVAAVLIARAFFPSDPTWELIALIALVMGRYWMGKGAGVTNVVWGIVVHDPIVAFLVLLFGGISFTIFRERRSGRLVILGWVALILILRHPQQTEYIGAAITLVGLLAWIYQKIPDDLDLPTENAQASPQIFRFFRGDRGILSLEGKLEAQKVGQKAATLSDLKRCGYAVPDGWILPAGDDPQPLIDFLAPSINHPLVVRSSAVGEDSAWASAAGQYQTILNVTSREALQNAILACQISYQSPMAMQYRRDRNQTEASMAILIQKQIRGVFSGVAFSRDPIDQFNPTVVIEALPGDAAQIVSGKVTPQQHRVEVRSQESEVGGMRSNAFDLTSPQPLVRSQNSGDLPSALLELVAAIAREIETLYHGIPQDIEWTYDGQQLWILQARAITTLQPIWTRKIAAEVIPGVIRPLTWSINRPLTCGVWGEIFTLVLGKRVQNLNFDETATLHYQRAYFNATLLGEIFRRMGLPAESLEFLTRGAKFSKPPLLTTTLRNFPGLFRLLRREWNLDRDFQIDTKRYFTPTLSQLETQTPDDLAPHVLLERIESILAVLKRATYYSILAPLSLALRQAIFKVSPDQLDNAQTPEVESLRSLTNLATEARNLLPMERLDGFNCNALFTYLAETPDGRRILEKFEQWLERYGYLSEVGTDIAVSRWKEYPHPARELFTQFLFAPERDVEARGRKDAQSWKTKLVQKRLNLKGQATAVYSQLLAHLRWSFIALAKHWQRLGLFSPTEALFFLELAEIRHLIEEPDSELRQQLLQLLEHRQTQFQKNQELPYVPYIIYGNPPAASWLPTSTQTSKRRLQGIGASPGQVEGQIKVLRTFQEMTDIDPQTILVVPYTDSGWAPLLARAGGIIAEVGGRLSHGAIIAREYGIPAVMDIHNATQWLRDGQRVRLDGQMGIVEILND